MEKRESAVEGRNEGAWLRRASRTYLMGRWLGRGDCRNGVVELGRRFGALDELESMKTLSPSLLVAT